MQAKKVLDAAIIVMSPMGICFTAKYPVKLLMDPMMERTNSHVLFPDGKIGSFLKIMFQYLYSILYHTFLILTNNVLNTHLHYSSHKIIFTCK